MTIVEQAAFEQGIEYSVDRPEDSPDEIVTDPNAVRDTVVAWQALLGHERDFDVQWAEGIDLPYFTDKPDWDGFMALKVLAANAAFPDLARGRKARVRSADVRTWLETPAMRHAGSHGAETPYPTLLSDAEWWLPTTGPGQPVFRGVNVVGVEMSMARLDSLREELRTLNEATLQLTEADLEAAQRRGPVDDPLPETMAPFGLAVFHAATEFAVRHQLPLLLDY